MSRRHPLLWLSTWLLLQSLSACTDSSPGTSTGPTSPDDAGVKPPTMRPDASFVAPVNAGPPTVAITSPDDGATVGSTVHVEGTANDDSGLAAVFVRIGPNTAKLATTTDGFRTWSFDGATPQGTFAIEAYAFDADGLRTPDPVRVYVNRPASGSGAGAPTVTIASPANGSTPSDLTVLVAGSSIDDVSVVRMEVLRNGELLDERPFDTEDFFATWARLVPLLPGQDNVLVFKAYDELGHVGQASLTLHALPRVDRQAPSLAVTTPAADASVATATLGVAGSASDNLGVREVKIRVGQVFAATGEVVWEDWVPATTSDGFGSFSATLPIPSGSVTIEVKAIDVSGLATSVVRTITSTYVAPWGEERAIPLFLRAQPNTTVRLDLDKAGVAQVINADIQKQLTILRLDPSALLTNALGQIKNACGTSWQLDNTDPQHDCSLTALGQTFHGSNGSWQTSAEYSLVRLLTMTPANVVVDGTSIVKLKNLADALQIGGGFRDILSETLGISRTTEIVSTANVAAALQTDLLETHPAIGAAGTIPITLYDAMNDLSPLGTTLGPSGSHPGVLDPSVPPHSVVFDSTFLMTIIAQSNLRWLDGVILSSGKEYISVVVDTTGPTYTDVLEFDFNDPARFAIQGLVPTPTVDLRMKVLENAAIVPACTTDTATAAQCQGNLPSTPFGTTYLWSKPAWQTEHIVGRAAYNQYQSRQFSKTYKLLGLSAANVYVGRSPNPLGWAQFQTLLNLGAPPPDQYLWELINEVAQVALHRLPSSTIPEGQANVAFTLKGIPVGLTADQIRASVRPTMQAQASTLSDMLLGDYAANNGAVDFYYRRGADGVPTVYFVAPGDPRPVATYGYAHPGFFQDPGLTTKASSLVIAGSGDTTHEKLRLSAGETVVYAQNEAGQVYRLRFVVGADPTQIVVHVARRNP